jgi:S-formylglutathione hydrolase
MNLETRSTHRCFGGTQGFYRHHSDVNGCPMRFAVFTPPQAASGPVPMLVYLSGLTCTEENFVLKAGAQRRAAELGLMLVVPDTSPRDCGLPAADVSGFGEGASYYVDATAQPWARHYQMSRYVNEELPALIERHFPARGDRRGIFGHSMGGHGALVSALRHPGRWHSLSALAPVANPSALVHRAPLFEACLGPDRARWREWDACELLGTRQFPGHVLVDQGLEDALIDSLMPDALETAARANGQALTLRRQAGYDHGYFFVASVVDDHLAHHAAILLA